jgi:hypothetical protein
MFMSYHAGYSTSSGLSLNYKLSISPHAENVVSIMTTNHGKGAQTQAGLHAMCPLLLSDINQQRNLSTIFSKNQPNMKPRKSVRWESLCSMRTDRHDTTNRRFTPYTCSGTPTETNEWSIQQNLNRSVWRNCTTLVDDKHC